MSTAMWASSTSTIFFFFTLNGFNKVVVKIETAPLYPQYKQKAPVGFVHIDFSVGSFHCQISSYRIARRRSP